MAFFQRNLSISLGWACACLSLSCLVAHGQPKELSAFRALSLGGGLKNLYYDHLGEPVELTVGVSALSKSYPLVAGQPVTFYRLVPAENGVDSAPKQLPLAKVGLPDKGPYLIFLKETTISSRPVEVWAVSDNWTEHPIGTMRVFNFTRQPIAAKVGNEVLEIVPRQSALYRYSGQNQTWLQVASEKDGEWKLSVSKPLVTLSDMRSTIVIIDEEASIEFPNPKGLSIRNVMEPAPGP